MFGESNAPFIVSCISYRLMSGIRVSYYYLVTSYTNPALLPYGTWSLEGLPVIAVRRHTL